MTALRAPCLRKCDRVEAVLTSFRTLYTIHVSSFFGVPTRYYPVACLLTGSLSFLSRHGECMSRVCGYRNTTTGRPCTQVVEDFHDHCEAGHPCLPPRAFRERTEAVSRGLAASVPVFDTEALGGSSAKTTAVFPGGVSRTISTANSCLERGSSRGEARGDTVRLDSLLTTASPVKRRAMKLSGVHRVSRAQALAFYLTLRDGPLCCYCTTMLTDANRTLEHVIPRSEGGPTTMENLRLACVWCNQGRQTKTLDEFLTSEAFRRRYLETMREKTIDPDGYGYTHVGPVTQTASPNRVIWRCEACHATTKGGRLDAVPCVEAKTFSGRNAEMRVASVGRYA